jgi:hypothetical protein
VGAGCRGSPGGPLRQHHLGVAGDLDGAAGGGSVGEGDPAQLDVVVRRHHDIGVGVEVAVAAPELRAAL